MTTTSPRVFAVVPAAGRSRRMGAPKQLLDVGGRPMLATVIEPLRAARVVGVCLVIHRGIANAFGESPGSRVRLVFNDDEASEMIDSVRLGLASWFEHEVIDERDGFLVCPGDHPGIRATDFDACIDVFRARPDRVVIGSRAGRRGHPIVFPASLAPYVRSPRCDGGLHAIGREHPDRVVLVELGSSGVTRDVDTPADYGAMP